MVNNATNEVSNFRDGGLVNDTTNKVSNFRYGGLVNDTTNKVSNFRDGGLVNSVLNNVSSFKKGGLVNSIRNKISSFKAGGMVKSINMPHFQEGGTVGDAKSYQFLQFAGEGRGSFDAEATIEKFAVNLDRTDPAVQKVVRQMEDLARLSNNLTKEQILEHDYSLRINRELIKLLPSKKKEAEVTKETAGAVKDLGESSMDAIKKMKNEFEGFAQEFTGPIKSALSSGGDVMEGLKQGILGITQKISGKLLDRAFAPLEKSIDNWLDEMFGTSTTEPTGSPVDPISTREVSDVFGAGAAEAGSGGILSSLTGAPTGATGAATPATARDTGALSVDTSLLRAMEKNNMLTAKGIKQQPSLFDGLGGLLQQGWSWISDAFSGLTSSLGGMFSNMGGGGSGGGIGGFISSLFGGGGGAGGGIGGFISSIFGMQEGGKVEGQGSGTSDSIVARLSNGEFVINAEATKKYMPMLEAINSGKMGPEMLSMMPAFAEGGLVGSNSMPSILNPGDLGKDNKDAMGGAVTINQTLNITEAMDPKKFQQELVKNNKVVVGLVQQSFNKRGQNGPQGYGQ